MYAASTQGGERRAVFCRRAQAAMTALNYGCPEQRQEDKEKVMKKLRVYMVLLVWLMSCGSAPLAQADALDDYLSAFTYQERQNMKISSAELVDLLREDKAQLIDIRFPEEYAAWHMGFAVNIPLNELPSRLDELDRSKIIVTACPHKDRAALARLYLAVKGYKSKYLKDGLLYLARHLRGDRAKAFMDGIRR